MGFYDDGGQEKGLKSRKPGILTLAFVFFKEEKKCRLSTGYTLSSWPA